MKQLGTMKLIFPTLMIAVTAAATWLFCGCGSPQVVAHRGPGQALAAVKPGLAVCVLDPKLTYQIMSTEEPADGAPLGAPAVKADLIRAASEALAGRGFRVERAEQNSLADELSAASEELLRGVKSPALLARLEELGQRLPADAVLVQFFKIKVGPGGWYDPSSGAITSPLNNGHLRVAILETRGARVRWENEVYLREVPRVERRNYRKAIEALYAKPETINKH
jgi:hypothetical protein